MGEVELLDQSDCTGVENGPDSAPTMSTSRPSGCISSGLDDWENWSTGGSPEYLLAALDREAHARGELMTEDNFKPQSSTWPN